MLTKPTIKITVDKSHLFTLGEKMYRESIEFIRELVSNAYDADATEVRVMITGDKIIVADNGAGMNEKGLTQFFRIGSEEKKKINTSPRFGRKRIGQFGVGKFSALSLTDRFVVGSVKGKYKYAVIFNRFDWQGSDSWNLPIKKERATALDREGTTIILDKLTKKVSANEVEKYLQQSVPLRAKKFAVYLNNKKITAKTVPGRVIPINIKTMYGSVTGEIIIALNSADVEDAGVECRVKQVFIKRELFNIEKKHTQGTGRLTGAVNADWLPLLSSRSDFIVDSPEYKLFYLLMQAQLHKLMNEIKKQGEQKNIQKITKELQNIMKQVRSALILNPDFVPQGKAVARLKKEGRKKQIAAGADLSRLSEKANQGLGDEQKESDTKDAEGAENPENKDKKTKSQEDERTAENKIEAKPLVMKKIRLKKLGIACGIVSLGESGPEIISQGNMVYINQDHPLYRKLYKKRDLLGLHLLRLLTQEIVLMKKLRITAREAFDWQAKLLHDALCGK